MNIAIQGKQVSGRDLMEQTEIAKILEELDLTNLQVIFDAQDVARKEAAAKLSFADALKRSLTAFVVNPRGSGEGGKDSPLDVILSGPEFHNLASNATSVEASAKLHEYLATDRGASVVLLTTKTVQQEKYRFTPEYDESIEDNWIFRILLPTTLDLLFWAIVDNDGQRPAYSYSFD